MTDFNSEHESYSDRELREMPLSRYEKANEFLQSEKVAELITNATGGNPETAIHPHPSSVLPAQTRREFTSGANRNNADHKPDYEGFLSIKTLRRYGEYMHAHSFLADGTRRSSDNWQKGIPMDVYVKSLLRHVFDVWELHRRGATEQPPRPLRDAKARAALVRIIDFDGNEVTLEEALCGVLFNAFGMLHEVVK